MAGRRYDALHELSGPPGIEEVVILATCNRTEFVIWAGDAPVAVRRLFGLPSRAAAPEKNGYTSPRAVFAANN